MEMSMIVWYPFFFLFLAVFLLILYKERHIRYLFYAFFGAVFGFFLFDVPSVALGYYTYVESYYLFMLYGVPISMSLAEGFCVAITIYIYEKRLLFLSLLKK
jgi:hypothetical protein